MFRCPSCGGRAVETEEFLVCENCGLVLDQLVEGGFTSTARYDPNGQTWVLVEIAQWLGLPLSDCTRVYRLARYTGADKVAAIAVALYSVLRERGEHVPLRRICDWLEVYGVKVSFKRAVKGLLRVSRYLKRPTPLSALKVYERKLDLDEDLVKRAEEIVLKVRHLGGRDPHLVAIASIYIAAEGKISLYRLAKETRRAPSRIRDNTLYLINRLQQEQKYFSDLKN